MKKKKRSQITKLILLISFLILFGRFTYSSIAALDHHQKNKQTTPEKIGNHQMK
ncbi:conserved hypothetical protein [Photorhabdus asymbiotica]|uniref:DUF2633 family protein n=2 Tax=Photorhabdus asymbiotica TaxID=291112 RepID=C7BTL2_PHOAA|nr:uncharacterized protein DUF2633 [Photorhabdus asymbiotica]CAQ83867.1 conserved hypothetical protein [Photorhabdus asymbiotica]